MPRQPRRSIGRSTPGEPCASLPGISTLVAQDLPPVLLEVGPGNVLSTLALQTLKGRAIPVVTVPSGRGAGSHR
ncbi:MAG: hypothetical protein WDM77_04345 [Steroidobacteraceae bacterium]